MLGIYRARRIELQKKWKMRSVFLRLRFLSRLSLVRIAILCVLMSFAGEASGEVGTTGGAFLRVTPMSRPLAMGNAYTGLAQGIESLAFNPAGLHSVKNWDVGVAHALFPFDVNFSYIGLGKRLSDRTVSGLEIRYLGSEDEARDARGGLTGTFTNYDFSVGLSFAYDLSSRLSGGGALRFIRSTLGDFSSTTFGGDIGFHYRPEFWEGMRFGIAAKNLGPAFKFISNETPQPLEFRIGASWQPPHNKYVVSGDLSVDREAVARAHLGAEYRIVKSFALRSGFEVGPHSSLITALKLGMNFSSRVGSVDYAYESQGDLGNVHRLSFSYLGGNYPSTSKRSDTTSFFGGSQRVEVPTVAVSVERFVNLNATSENQWLEEGFKEIVIDRLKDEQFVRLTRPVKASYLLKGRYLTLSDNRIWIGVDIVNRTTGRTVGFQEATFSYDDLLRSTATLVGGVASRIPSSGGQR